MPPSARRRLINSLPNFLPFLITFLHVFLAPYTKVEESFTLHAVHDVLKYGLRAEHLHLWDHVEFPGAVPRSFIPAIVLGILSYPFAAIGVATGIIRTTIHVQILVRLVLASIHSIALNHLSRTLRSRYPASVRRWWLIFTLTQFHTMYYAGRTIPNFLAYPFVVLFISLVLRANSKSAPSKVSNKRRFYAIGILTAVASIVRLEIALFLLPNVLALVFLKRIPLHVALIFGALGGLGAVYMTNDYKYTQWRPTLGHPSFPFKSPYQLVWPELSGLWYNIVQGKSADWGTSPRHHYLFNALPKICGPACLLLLVGTAWQIFESVLSQGREGERRKSLLPESYLETWEYFSLGTIALVVGMSFVGHKEWRFVVYAVPVINMIAASVASAAWHFPHRLSRRFFRLGLVGLVAIQITFTLFATFLSVHNYPGGEVWQVLEDLQASSNVSSQITIHFTSGPLQTGSTLFTFLHASPGPDNAWPYPAFPPPRTPEWTYSKSEAAEMQTLEGLWQSNVDYIVTDDPSALIESELPGRSWKLAAHVGEVGETRLDLPGIKKGRTLRWGSQLAILARESSRTQEYSLNVHAAILEDYGRK
ncbi:Alg9-like mannosyltransferase family-domain-containing protein [Naematelia encephala]|uniref:Mannosyltransferase n=1 Tax=Naematelia encephala TaxID=71784 RepID=A0A1Y2BBR2_9TREE|nr:Alg9-like mannosyltransferase family-domain-containing protein [Naematelia encephala]